MNLNLNLNLNLNFASRFMCGTSPKRLITDCVKTEAKNSTGLFTDNTGKYTRQKFCKGL